jgi:glycosyltransferase involved in cell wall biosynthesis
LVTLIPSPYQVELFNALTRSGISLRVVYLQKFLRSRLWEMPAIEHEHCFLDQARSGGDEWIKNSEFVVFCCYQQMVAQRLIALRHDLNLPWVFWGERPGVRMSGWLGRRFRAWAQRDLHRSGAPIWGIGSWAVEGYKREFGDERSYINVPYFSNLDPLFALKRSARHQPCRFLFSGSFIVRKGVDILASAFRTLLQNGIDAEIQFFGCGPLENAIADQLSRFPTKFQVHGFRQWCDLANIYAVGDVLCAPSRYDGWGLVVPEGLASGMPVISTDQTGSARDLITGSNGWILPAGNEAALVVAMERAATLSEAERSQMSEMARQAAVPQNLASGTDLFTKAINLSLEAWNRRPHN